MDKREGRMRRVVAMAAFILLGTACNRYEWKPDYEVPSVCPPEKAPTGKPVHRDPELGLDRSSASGRILRADTREPVAGARVELLAPVAKTASTDSLGGFRLDSLATGRYVLRVRSLGYRPWSDTVSVVPAARPNLEIGLQSAPM